MRPRRTWTTLTLVLTSGFGQGWSAARAQEVQENPIEARVWLDRGQEPVLQRGDAVRLYYRTSEDAFVAIFHIDTNGTTRLVFPNSPQENHYARGGRDYRVLFPGSSYWYVEDYPGMGYFFIVASPEPFDFTELRYSHYGGGWDLSYVGRQVYQDPYLAMDDYVAALIPDWEYVPYGLDFTTYHVEQRYEYPRFLCYDCHGFRPFYSWNPYHYACTSFRVVIYNDPYYYPVTRYRGTRVVYVEPRRGVAHFGFKERADGEPWTPQVVVRDTPPRSQPGVAGSVNRRAQPKEGSASAGAVGPAQNRSGGSAPGSTIPGVDGNSGWRRTTSQGGLVIITPPGSTDATKRGTGVTQTPPRLPRTDPRSGVTSPTSPGRPIVTPPPSGGNGRPVVQTRPTTGSATRPNSGTTITRPSTKVRKSGGGGASSGAGRSGAAAVTGRPTVRGGVSGRTTVPTVRGGTSGMTRPPASRSGGSGAVTRNPTRSGGSGAVTRNPTRSGGSGAVKRAPTRGGGSSATVRPPTRSGGSSTVSRPTVRSGGSSGSSRPPPARAARPPTKKRSGGGL